MKIPQKLLRMQPYDPTEDRYKIKLDANESAFLPSEDISREIQEAMAKVALHRYPDPNVSNLRKKAAALFGVQMENLVVGNGSDELISVILNSFSNRGDRLMVLLPDFSMYAFYAGLAEMELSVACKDEEMEITAEHIIEAAQKEKPDILMFSNPCNPTGRGLKKEDMLRVISSVDCLVVADEAYMDFFGESILPESCRFENLIVLRTCSKAFGLAAARLGFAIGHPSLIGEINKARSPFNINAFSQAAGEVLLAHPLELKRSLERILAAKEALFEQLQPVCKQYPELVELRSSVTNFVIIKSKYAKQIYEALLKQSICVRCFNDFLRITSGTMTENRIFTETFSAILERMAN